MNQQPIDFCLCMAVALYKRRKTVLHRPLTRDDQRVLAASGSPSFALGGVGDQLWVREPYALDAASKLLYLANYTADGYTGKSVTPADATYGSGPMTQQQSRFLLTIQSTTLFQLNTLDEAGAVALGGTARGKYQTALDDYKASWDGMYRGSEFATNPTVWRVAFVTEQG